PLRCLHRKRCVQPDRHVDSLGSGETPADDSGHRLHRHSGDRRSPSDQHPELEHLSTGLTCWQWNRNRPADSPLKESMLVLAPETLIYRTPAIRLFEGAISVSLVARRPG